MKPITTTTRPAGRTITYVVKGGCHDNTVTVYGYYSIHWSDGTTEYHNTVSTAYIWPYASPSGYYGPSNIPSNVSGGPVRWYWDGMC
jgi:hypothetical protein